MRKIQIAGVIVSVLLLVGHLAFGGLAEVALPFKPLELRVRLLGYQNYIALATLPPLLLGAIGVLIHQLLHPVKSTSEYADIYKGFYIKFTWLIIVLPILAIGPRYYLGYQVTKAGYVKCVKESRTSSKSSWRIYAKHEALCKSSSGIAGG